MSFVGHGSGFRFPEVLAWVTGLTELIGGALAGPGAISVDAGGRFLRVLSWRWAFLVLGLTAGLFFHLALRT